MQHVDDFTKRIDPELQPYLNSVPAIRVDNLSMELIAMGARQRPVLFPLVPDETVEILDDFIPSGAAIRIYKPADKNENLPVFVYFYGGGFFTGGLDHNDSLCQNIVKSLGCAIVAVEYRKIPEHPYPAGFDDCYQTYLWAALNPMFDQNRLMVGGISAGGAYAAGVALKARDEKGPALQGQLLMIPCIDYRFETQSSTCLDDPRVWHLTIARKAWASYLRNCKGNIPIYASPSLAPDLSGLPPAVVTVEGEDILRDEGIFYAQRMMGDGTATDLHVFAGAFHGSFAYMPDADVSRRHYAVIMAAIQKFLKLDT